MTEKAEKWTNWLFQRFGHGCGTRGLAEVLKTVFSFTSSGMCPFYFVALGLAPPFPSLLCRFILPEYFLSNILAKCSALLAEMQSEGFEALPSKIQF